MAKWLAAAIITRTEKGVLEVMVVDQTSTHPKYKGRPMQTKFPAGTEENHEQEDKTVLDTLRREILEETGLTIPENYLPRLILSENLPGHFKNFYLIPRSDMLGEEKTEDAVIDFDHMKPPRWVAIDTVGRELYRSHQPALLKAMGIYRTTI
jgi:8-oxo-dGTP pyrophosphatase MutT (NUDIX family)